MACYCWKCGTEAYKGYRDYKCENPDCELYKQPIFPAETPDGMSKLPQEITAMEREAIEAMQEADEFSRDELVEKLELDSPDHVSDLMRSLRYKGRVSFSFDRGFELENTE